MTIEEAGRYSVNGENWPRNTNQVNDVNGILDQYLGIWKGDFDMNKIEIIVIKRRYISSKRDIAIDGINFSYKIFDNNNILLFDSNDSKLEDAYGVLYSPIDNRYVLQLTDACDRSRGIYLKPVSRSTKDSLIIKKMEFKITTPVVVEQIDDTIAKDCISVNDFLPQGTTVLLKAQ
jgi:predicted amino acid racemase